MDLNIEIEEFKTAWLSSGGHFKFYEYNPKFSKFEPTGFNGTLTQEELLSALVTVNTSWGMWQKAKQAKSDGVVIRASDIEYAILSGPENVKQLEEHLENVVAQKALEKCHGNICKASNLIGINRGTLSKRHKRFIQKKVA